MTTIIEIGDVSDARLAPYRDVKDRDLVGRGGAFMAEGQVVIERLFVSKLCVTTSVLTTPDRLKNLNISNLSDDVPVFVVAQDVMNALAGFVIHRGYLALGRYVPTLSLTEVLTGDNRIRVLALSAIANVDNMGGLMRNAAAFGVDAVILDQTCCDPLYRKAIRVGVGAVFQVPHFRLRAGEALLDVLRAHDLTPYALSPAGETTLKDVKPALRSALIFGSEGPGLDPQILSGCTSVQIPMSGGFDSLNVATTSGIVLYHMCF
jgi:tRNA G18 (ribose-2'-O)-methylase SpoU